MLQNVLDEMQKSAAAVEPLYKRFADGIAGDVRSLRQVDAPEALPLTEPAQGEAVQRLRRHVDAFERELGEIHQQLLTNAKKLSLGWILPGDAQTEVAKVDETASHLPHTN